VEVWLAGALDLLGEPKNRYHPVAWFGGLAKALEARFYRDSAITGLFLTLFLVLLAAGTGFFLERALFPLPEWGRYLLLALFLKPTFALKSLLDAVLRVEEALQRDLDLARRLLAEIVSRDTRALDPYQVRMAAIESLAENLVDSVVSPLFYYLFLGLPGAYLFRAANTLDALWGYKNARFERFGRAAARLDDLLGYLPARITGLLLTLRRGPSPLELLREARKTPSPNAGWPIGAFAFRLGLRLEKPGVYLLNPKGRLPESEDLFRALSLARFFGYLWIFAVGMVLWEVGR